MFCGSGVVMFATPLRALHCTADVSYQHVARTQTWWHREMHQGPWNAAPAPRKPTGPVPSRMQLPLQSPSAHQTLPDVRWDGIGLQAVGWDGAVARLPAIVFTPHRGVNASSIKVLSIVS